MLLFNIFFFKLLKLNIKIYTILISLIVYVNSYFDDIIKSIMNIITVKCCQIMFFINN